MHNSIRNWLVLLLTLAMSPHLQGQQQAAPPFDHEHSGWTAILAEHLQGSDFDYAALKKDRKALDAYLKSLEAVDGRRFAEWKREQRYAFWINAYNAYTIRAVVEAYPVKSITDIGSKDESVWDQRSIPLGKLWKKAKGAKLSLNQIEHELLRPEFKDPRVHAAVNCASKGCPPLAAKAFASKTLEEQLDRATRAWLADAARNRFEPSKKRVRLSKIFEWFPEDFTRGKSSLGGWLAKYAPEEHREFLSAGKFSVQYLEYDWALNAAKSR